jgi:hypothetical protein
MAVDKNARSVLAVEDPFEVAPRGELDLGTGPF